MRWSECVWPKELQKHGHQVRFVPGTFIQAVCQIAEESNANGCRCRCSGVDPVARRTDLGAFLFELLQPLLCRPVFYSNAFALVKDGMTVTHQLENPVCGCHVRAVSAVLSSRCLCRMWPLAWCRYNRRCKAAIAENPSNCLPG